MGLLQKFEYKRDQYTVWKIPFFEFGKQKVFQFYWLACKIFSIEVEIPPSKYRIDRLWWLNFSAGTSLYTSSKEFNAHLTLFSVSFTLKIQFPNEYYPFVNWYSDPQ
jgi:hypothetical protein